MSAEKKKKHKKTFEKGTFVAFNKAIFSFVLFMNPTETAKNNKSLIHI
jgi:hypothetical protein